MVDTLKKNDIKVSYAIHPVADVCQDRCFINTNVPYDEVFELEEITMILLMQMSFVIGANDVTNPVAKTDPQSPIYGMPVLDVENVTSSICQT